MGTVRHPGLSALLDVHSFFSFGKGVSSPATLAGCAAELGYRYVALTDELNTGGAAELWRAATTLGITPIIGTTVPFMHEGMTFPLLVLAASRLGYTHLNHLLTLLLYDGQNALTLDQLAIYNQDVFALTGPRGGFPSALIASRRFAQLSELMREFKTIFRDRLYVQLYFDEHPDDQRRMRTLRALAHHHQLPAVAAPQVRYAHKDDYPLYDALRCAREGVSVHTPHPSRPTTRAHYVRKPGEWANLMPFPDALQNAETLAKQLSFELEPERLIPPRVEVPEGSTPAEHLQNLCLAALPETYPSDMRAKAEGRLHDELAIIHYHGFAEFFLAVHEVMAFCYSRAILASARGSAAASITCYLLGITHTEPLANGLVFERFLHAGKRVTPDLDIDIASARRDEVLAWVEQRFGGPKGGHAQEAMVANRITYRIRSALQDLGRALGLPAELRNHLSRVLGRDYGNIRPHHARDAEARVMEVLGEAPAKHWLLRLLTSIEPGFTRHFAPHSGGVILSRHALSHYAAQFRSANGMRVLQVDKEDAEWLGLIKLDLLGLRMLSCLERAREEVMRTCGQWLDVFALPDDPEVWADIARGDTLTLFQIESPRQMVISSQLKPRCKAHLAHQIAIHRPGPIVGDAMRTFRRRHTGQEPTRYLHPALERCLGDTYGTVIYQDQVLQVAVHFAGYSWGEADTLRKRLNRAETVHDSEEEREAFVTRAKQHVNTTREQADAVFDAIRGFHGYGFVRSHAFAFAEVAYASAWFKHHHPAAWMAAFFTEHPGMWPRETLRQECKRLGVALFPLDINCSGVAFHAERNEDGTLGVRVALSAVTGVSEEVARRVLESRLLGGRYTSVDDLQARVKAPLDALEALVKAGAFDTLHDRRTAYYRLQALTHTHAAQGQTLFDLVPEPPRVARLTLSERLALDVNTMGLSALAVHPMETLRYQLKEFGVTPLTQLTHPREWVRTAGLVVAKQKPPTAGGAAFYVIEDGTQRVHVQVSPEVWQACNRVLRDARLLIVQGRAIQEGAFIAIRAEQVWEVPVEVKVKGYDFS